MKHHIILFALTLFAFTTALNAIHYDVWQDTDFDGVKDVWLGGITAYSGGATPPSAWVNYGFSSASAHPIYGPTPEAFKSKMYLYNGSDGLSFGFFHNVDNGGNTTYWNHVRWDFGFYGITPTLAGVDDSSPENQGEPGINPTGADTWHAGWAYMANTDGGVFLVNPDNHYWEIHVDPSHFSDIQYWQMYSGDDSYISLYENNPGFTAISPTGDYICETPGVYTTIITPHIPEPGTLILVGAGLIGARLAIRRRRK